MGVGDDIAQGRLPRFIPLPADASGDDTDHSVGPQRREPVVLVDEGGQGWNRRYPRLGVGEIPGGLNGEVSGAAAERRVNIALPRYMPTEKRRLRGV